MRPTRSQRSSPGPARAASRFARCVTSRPSVGGSPPRDMLKEALMRRVALVFVLCAVPSLAAQTPAPYQITHTFVLGGDGRWDYVIPDPPRHRVFIARQDRHGRGRERREVARRDP